MNILKNEKYKGDALLQKTFTVDFLTKKHKVNEGEVQQYYVKGNHEAIIPPVEFDRVQSELARRKAIGRGYSCSSVFSSRIICGDCGGFYGQKVWHSNDPYRKKIWRCNCKYGNVEKCRTPTLTEEKLKSLFLKAYNLLMADRDSIAEDCRELVSILGDTAELDAKIESTQKEIDRIVAENSRLIRSFAADGEENASFESQATEYDAQFNKAQALLDKLKKEREERLNRCNAVQEFIRTMLEQPLVLEKWDEQLWCQMTQKAVISSDGTVTFTFRGENSITVRIE